MLSETRQSDGPRQRRMFDAPFSHLLGAFFFFRGVGENAAPRPGSFGNRTGPGGAHSAYRGNIGGNPPIPTRGRLKPVAPPTSAIGGIEYYDRYQEGVRRG